MKKFFNETLQNVKPNRQAGLEPEHIEDVQQEFDTVKRHINLFIGDEFIFDKDKCININEYTFDKDGFDKPWLTFGPSKKFNPGDSVILKQFKSSSPSNLKDLRYNIIVSSDDGQQELLQLKNWDHKDVLGFSPYFRFRENINVTIGGLRKIIKEELETIMNKQTPLKKWYELNNNHFNFDYHHEDEIKNNPDMLDNEEYEGLGDYADEIVIDGRMRGGGTYGYHDKEQDAVYLLHPSRGYVKMTDPNVHNWPTLDDEEDENDPRWPGESEETRWKF